MCRRVFSSWRRSRVEIREGAVGAGTRPEPNGALRRGELQIVDKQARLLGVMHIEAGLAAGQQTSPTLVHAPGSRST